jgi:hypothetical protein
MQIDIKVVPGSSKDEISGWLGDALKLRVRAAPEKGKANKAVTALLADALNIAPTRICIERGETRPLKRVSIDGIDTHSFAKRLGLADTP